MVERQLGRGMDPVLVWLMKRNIRLPRLRRAPPPHQGKVERFYGSLEQARCKRDLPPPGSRQIWLDRFRDDYNRVRPHGALGMETPASVLTASPRSYNPDPASWQYPAGAELLRLENSGQLTLNGRRWQVAGALAEGQFRLLRIEQCVLVYFRSTLVHELDFAGQGSTEVEACPARFQV